MAKRWWYGASIGLLVVMGVGYFAVTQKHSATVSPLGRVQEKPYEKYSIPRLVERSDVGSSVEEREEMFYYTSEGRKISGMVKHPEGEERGVIVMARGYVEKDGYITGTGTKNAATYYAKNGYLTYAPDFSGYGESDPEDPNALGARLVKPVEILDLIASVRAKYPMLPIFLWGHSNGGQIMLTISEVLGKRNLQGETLKVKGVILWAPVSKPFPYNILYYTDEADDKGKWLRGQIAEFEADYDVFNYSLDRYLDWIALPIQLHQGTADEAVPKKWSDELGKSLEEKEKKINYYVYPGADHNMKPNWDTVVARDVEWMKSLAKTN